MKPRPRRDKLDGMDAELIRETLRTPGWRKIEARIRKTIDLAVESLMKPQTEVGTANLRGQIGALRTALLIPTILISEAKDKPVPRTDEREV